MAGAGRAVGTWLMAQAKDRTLLDFLQVHTNDIIARKGLIDRYALHERWDTKLVLLQNGRKRIIKPPGHKAAENLDNFTWLMALVVASLDAAVSLSSLKKVMHDFLTMLFGDHIDGLDYLLHELPRHIEGWLSIATVRNITARAGQEWKYLADLGVHEAGLVPYDDVGEISRLLVWIAGSHDQEYETSSSDAFSIAVVLRVIGLELLSTDQGVKEHDENQLVVRLAKDPIGKTPSKRFWQLRERWGMRVPLQCMQECVSLWPGTAAENNERRRVFEDGMSAAKGLKLVPTKPRREKSGNLSLFYELVVDEESQQIGRVDGVVHRLATDFFPATTPAIVKGLQPLAENLSTKGVDEDIKDTSHIMQLIEADPALVAELQTFVMGFYYSLLISLLDTSQLSVPQAFGSWGWYDLNLLYKLGDTLSATYVKPGRFYRHGIMRLLALLYGGAEEQQLPLIVDGVVGVLGKLSLLTASLLGDVDSWEKAGKFFLIDIDPTCIPCTSRGIVTSTRRYDGFSKMISDTSNDVNLCELGKIDLHGTGVDFTSHIEPDWENDIQLCRIAFRFKGRLMNHLSPLDCDYGILEDSPLPPLTEEEIHSGSEEREIDDNIARPMLEMFLVPRSIHNWTNKFVVGPNASRSEFNENRPPTLIPTKGRNRARTCFRAWYWRNGYHALPSRSPYAHIPDLRDSQVLWHNDNQIYDFECKSVGEGKQTYLRALQAPGRHLILA